MAKVHLLRNTIHDRGTYCRRARILIHSNNQTYHAEKVTCKRCIECYSAWMKRQTEGRLEMPLSKETEFEVKIVRVKWRDSCILHDQQRIDADFDIAMMESIGFLLRQDDTKIVLAGEILENGHARRIIVIPKENIVMQAEITNGGKKVAHK